MAIRKKKDLTNEAVGRRVRVLREDLGKTQQQLATQAELALRTLAALEGGAEVSLTSLRKVAAALGVNVADLLEPKFKVSGPGPGH
jgi:transcriptional regulator with XRE-family HTH domain